jgi:hypothetical protein
MEQTKQHLLQQIKLSTLSEENKTPLIEFIQKRIDEITVAYQIPNSKIKEIF